jgi:CRISPR type III-A-associated RAMP protein Csm4
MTRAALIRLRPTGPWRIGPDSGKPDETDRVLHSDTLFSAVTIAMRSLGWLEEWLDATARAESPAVSFSSAFPFLKDTLYVTPPATHWPPVSAGKVRWKGARFVPVSLVQSLLADQAPDEEKWAIDGASQCVVPADRANAGGPVRVSVRSGIGIDAFGSAVAPYQFACLEFAPDAGVWLAAVFRDSDAERVWGERLRAVFRLLADTGIGGERSRGWGHFAEPEIRFGDFPRVLITTPEGAEGGASGHWLLSLYGPGADEPVDLTRGHYSVTERAGRVESLAGWGGRKPALKMIAEGSVVLSAAPPRGQAVDQAPEGAGHAVYRSGFAVSVSIPLRSGG